MKASTSLFWKEWRETRIYLWISLGVFLGLPMIGGIEAAIQHQSRQFEILVSPWVVILGGVLAIFVAVGATCRDLHSRLEDFWRSRPVGVMRWLLTKYFVGLAVVIASCVLPLLAELCIDRDRDTLVCLMWGPFLWTALYSIGFLAGCLLRHVSHAATLALSAMLLVWVLPQIFPPFSWMNISVINPNARGYMLDEFGRVQIEFAAAMLAVSLLALLPALVAVRRDWVVVSGWRLIYASLTAAVLLLLGSAVYQLGTNLPVLQRMELPEGETLGWAEMDDMRGILQITKSDPTNWSEGYRPIQIGPSGIELAPPTFRPHDENVFFSTDDVQVTFVPRNLGVYYFIRTETVGAPYQALMANSLMGDPVGPPQRVWNSEVPAVGESPRGIRAFELKDRLYVLGGKTDQSIFRMDRLDTFDISEPLKPQLISDRPIDYVYRYPLSLRTGGIGNGFTLALPPISELSPPERVKAALQIYLRVGDAEFQGDILCLGPVEYRLTKTTDTAATFEMIGQIQEPLLNEVFGSYQPYTGFNDIEVKNGLIYTLGHPRNPLLYSSVTVFDARSSHPSQTVGHFSAPGLYVLCPLSDGRAIVGSDTTLWLLGPPPKPAGN